MASQRTCDASDFAEESHVIVVGDPGTGKSTFLNALVGSGTFEAGLSRRSGLTKCIQSVVIDGTRYSDTPGLDDTALKEQAARAIVEAVQKGGNVKLFFILTMEAGRLRPSNLATIRMVLKALQARDIAVTKRFYVVINKVTPGELDMWTSDPKVDAKEELTEEIALAAEPADLRFLPDSTALRDRKNAIHPDRRLIVGFVDQAVTMGVPAGTTIELRVDQLDAETARLEKQLRRRRRRMRRAAHAVSLTAKVAIPLIGAAGGLAALPLLL